MAGKQPQQGAPMLIRQKFRYLAVGVLALQLGACAGSQQSSEPDSPRSLTDESRPTQTSSAPQTRAADTPPTPAQPEVSPEEQAATEAARAAATAERERAEFEAALRMVRSAEYDSARRELQRFASHEDFGAWAQYNIGVIAFQQGDADEAQRLFRRALEMDPGHGPAATALVRGMLRDGDVAGAQRLIDAQLQASESAPGIRAAGLFIGLERGQYQQVIEDARSVFIDEPGNLDAHYALAMAQAELGRTQLANYVLRQGLRRDGNRADFYYGLGHLALEEGNDQLARTYLGRALTLQPRFPEANLDMGYLHMLTQAYDEAAEAFGTVTELVPNWAEAWLSLGNAYKGQQRYEEAHSAFERAAELDPQYAAPYYNLGILYLDVQGFRELELMARLEEAVSYFERYKEMKGASLSEDDPVHAYEEYARNEIQIQIDLANPPEEETWDDGGWDEEGGSEEGASDGSEDEWGDDWGDEGGSDDSSSDDGWDDDWK